MEKSVTEWTTAGSRLRSQLYVYPKQQLKKLEVLQQGMAHFESLFSWQIRDSPKGFVCSSSLRGITPTPSPYSIKSAALAIKMADHASR